MLLFVLQSLYSFSGIKGYSVFSLSFPYPTDISNPSLVRNIQVQKYKYLRGFPQQHCPQHCQRHQGPQSEPSMNRCCKYFCHLSLLADVKGRGSHILCGYLPTMVQKSLVAQPSVLTSRYVPLHPSFLRKEEVTGEGRNQRSFKMLSEDF